MKVGAEAWLTLVNAHMPAPTDPAALRLLPMSAKPSFRAEFKAGEGGRMGACRLHGPLDQHPRQKGPWFEVTTATVAA